MSIASYLVAAPKAELHLHLEGAIRPATLLSLAHRNHVSLPADDVDGITRWFTFRDFNHFIEIYITITRCIQTPDDYELIVYDLAKELAAQNVKYAELTFSPGTHQYLGRGYDVYMAGLRRGRERARTDFGITLNWIFDIVRNNPERAAYTTDSAIQGMADGVVGLGLGGSEVGFPPEMFEADFARAMKAGLHSIPHAGELDGAQSVWGALRVLHAERIGHGVRSIEDPQLVAYLAEHSIALEVNPTSNLRLNIYPTIESHPLRRLYEAGVPITVNSDDPALFNTDLTAEVGLLDSAFGLDAAAMDAILLNGVRYSFQPDAQKTAMLDTFQSEMVALKKAHL